MKFKNRNVENPNVYTLRVLNMTGDFIGDITTMKVVISRNEGEVYEAGTALDAKNLSLLCQGYYIEDDNIKLIKGQGLNNNHKFIIYTDKLYSILIEPTCDSPFVLSETLNNGEIINVSVNLIENVNLNDLSAQIYTHQIKLFESSTQYLKGVIDVEIEVLADSISSDD